MAAKLRLALRYLAAVLLTVIVFLFPVYWLFMISFKTPDEIFHCRRSGIRQASVQPTMSVLFTDGDVVPRFGTAWCWPASAR